MRKLMTTAVIIICLAAAARASKPKQTGTVARCKIVEVYDGDTVTVEITIIARVRLIDCWAPEIKTKDKEEKAKGIASRNFLRSFAQGKRGLVFIPTGRKLGDSVSFSRVLGTIWIDGQNQKSIAEIMVENNYATKEK